MMYLEYLETVDFVERKIDGDGSEMFNLTEHGIKICKRRLSEQFERTKQKQPMHLDILS